MPHVDMTQRLEEEGAADCAIPHNRVLRPPNSGDVIFSIDDIQQPVTRIPTTVGQADVVQARQQPQTRSRRRIGRHVRRGSKAFFRYRAQTANANAARHGRV
eukprot:GHVU01196310.1.p1 GENE.GHVU01196310.1~~GHVU01196310.1.p1  ORF type:complete len:102 (+),score=3.91 GHVU01196310.1:148-453(+)